LYQIRKQTEEKLKVWKVSLERIIIVPPRNQDRQGIF